LDQYCNTVRLRPVNDPLGPWGQGSRSRQPPTAPGVDPLKKWTIFVAGRGNRAQQKRERNAKDAKSAPKSQLKVNENAKNIQCEICKSTFLMTTREPQLLQHAENKHSKTIADCFPTYGK
ncbi:hypothetical protein PoMZ_00875, partial [Pyricularia oryzae]